MEKNMYTLIFDLAEKHFPNEFKVRNNQLVTRYCPFCHGGDNKDEETFAIGLHNGAYLCMRGNCGAKGSFNSLCDYLGERRPDYTDMPTITYEQNKKYIKPSPDILKPITDEIKQYFATRRISEETLTDFKIASDGNGNIIFPFYRNGILTYVKYRKPKKISEEERKEKKMPKEWQMSNTEPILFGMDNVSFNSPLVITEGEIDAMAIYEAGYHNVVSVPCGCSNEEWIELCNDWLEEFNQIIIFGDNDEPGLRMTESVICRLGEDRCLKPKEYPEFKVQDRVCNRKCKDANEILYAYGPEFLKNMVESCEPTPIKGVLNLAKVPFVDPSSIPKILTCIPSLDNMIGGLCEGGVTVFSGRRGEGKSTLTGQLLLNAIQQGFKCCAYSGELASYKFLEWILLQATDRKYIEVKTDPANGKKFSYVSETIQQRIKDFVDGKFFLFDNAYIGEETQQKAVLKVFELCAKKYGCKLFVIDNLMVCLNSPDEENKAQARFAADLKAFAVKYKVHVVLVA